MVGYPSLRVNTPRCAFGKKSVEFPFFFFQICCCWSVLQHMLRYVCTDCPPSPVSHVRLHHQALVIQCLTSGLLRCHPWVSHYVDAEFRRATAYSREEGHHSIRDFYVCQAHHKTIKYICLYHIGQYGIGLMEPISAVHSLGWPFGSS